MGKDLSTVRGLNLGLVVLSAIDLFIAAICFIACLLISAGISADMTSGFGYGYDYGYSYYEDYRAAIAVLTILAVFCFMGVLIKVASVVVAALGMKPTKTEKRFKSLFVGDVIMAVVSFLCGCWITCALFAVSAYLLRKLSTVDFGLLSTIAEHPEAEAAYVGFNPAAAPYAQPAPNVAYGQYQPYAQPAAAPSYGQPPVAQPYAQPVQTPVPEPVVAVQEEILEVASEAVTEVPAAAESASVEEQGGIISEGDAVAPGSDDQEQRS